VRWADRQIELSDIPLSSLCDVAMASSRFPQDVARMLRSIPGDCDFAGAVRLTLGYMLDALRESTSDPRGIARALFDMAIACDLPDGDLKHHSFGYWDAIDLARDGVTQESESGIVADMIRRIETFLDDTPERRPA
jgi:hypothetical protein